MKQLFTGLLMIIICSWGSSAYGEEIWYPEGKRPIATISEKIHRSLGRAVFVAEGYFIKPQPYPTLEALDDTKGMLEIGFQLTRRFDQGKPALDSLLRLKLVVYRPLSGSTNDANAEFATSHNVELAYSGRTVEFDRYLNALAAARSPLLRASDYLKEFFIVPVAVGGLDTPYRVADVVVRLRKKYIIFIMRDIAVSKKSPVFPNDLDIYDAEEPDVLTALKADG